MEPRRLGTQGLTVSSMGLGCMGMSDAYGPADEGESVATIHRALELGITLLDTSDAYGPFKNEELIDKAIRGRRSRCAGCRRSGVLHAKENHHRALVRRRSAAGGMDVIDNLRFTKIALNNGSGAIPALGFGTLIPDPVATRTATRAALQAGFRVVDTAERYRTEREVGEAMQEVFEGGKIKREDVFVITKLWNTNHRPERVKPACEASLEKLQLEFVDLYLIHTPFAFQPGDDQDPRDANGNVIYDKGVTLRETWQALERRSCPPEARRKTADRLDCRESSRSAGW